MRWIEILKFRSVGTGPDEVKREIVRTAARIEYEAGLDRVMVYCHPEIDTDLRIHLHWTTGRAEVRPSVLGQRLASSMEEFGWVKHSVWIEAEKSGAGK